MWSGAGCDFFIRSRRKQARAPIPLVDAALAYSRWTHLTVSLTLEAESMGRELENNLIFLETRSTRDPDSHFLRHADL